MTVVINAVIGSIVGAIVSCCVGSNNSADADKGAADIVGPYPAVPTGVWKVAVVAFMVSTPIFCHISNT